MNTHVNFEIAKLLKEKGFVCHKSDKFWRDGFSCDKKDYNPITYQDKDNVATITEVVMWLYEKHGIWISVDRECESGVFFFSIDIDKGNHFYDKRDDFNSPTAAYEAAILYVLNNLI